MDTRSFELPASHRTTCGVIAALLVGLAGIHFALLLARSEWVWGVFAVGALALAAFFASTAVGSAGFEADDRGIRPLRRDGRWIRWDQVETLRNRTLLWWIDVRDARGRVLARLNYRLEDIDVLLAMVLERCPHIHPAPPLPAAFGFRGRVRVDAEAVTVGGWLGRERRIPLAGVTGVRLQPHFLRWGRRQRWVTLAWSQSMWSELRVDIEIGERGLDGVESLGVVGDGEFALYRAVVGAVALERRQHTGRP